MTVQTHVPVGASAGRASVSDRLGRLRRWICAATVLSTLPYIVLKLIWVAGNPVGASVDGFTDTTRAANILTAGLDIVGIALAVLFVAPFGRRISAFLVAFPAWVATGLLTPVVLGVVLGTPTQLLTGGGNPFADDGLSAWVYGLVYGGFSLQALLLGTGFVLYAVDRWSVVRRGGRPMDGAGTTRPLQTVLGVIHVVALLAFAALSLVWAVAGGGTFGNPDTSQRVFLLVTVVVALAAAAATIALLRGGRLTRLRLVLIWVGAGVAFTTALRDSFIAVMTGPSGWGATGAGPAERGLVLFVLLGVLAGSIGAAMRLVEEERRGQ